MSQLHQERLLQVLLAPQISEKATYVADKNEQIVFRVASNATKPEIKAAVEQLFDVKVKSVNTLRQNGKVKRFQGRKGRRSDYKKAMICLEEGHSIDVSMGI